MSAPEMYVVARDCNHRVYETSDPPRASIEWCESCRRYVGLIIQRVDSVHYQAGGSVGEETQQ